MSEKTKVPKKEIVKKGYNPPPSPPKPRPNEGYNPPPPPPQPKPKKDG